MNYYRAPEAPAPDYGAVVHANLGQAASRQAAINALVQLAGENQRLKAAKEEHAAAGIRDDAQLAETTRYHDAQIAGQQADLDERERAREDADARAESAQEEATKRQMLTQASNWLRNYHNEQGRMQRAQMEQEQRQAAAEARRQEALKKLEQQQRRNKAMGDAMVALSAVPSTFEEHQFSAAEVSPFFSPDPARMIASIKGSKFLAGKEETAEDVYNNMLKAKVPIRVAPEGWFANTLKPFAADLTPEDQMALAKYAHGPDMVPYASNSAEARARASDYFKGHSALGPMFQGGTEAQAAPPKASAQTPGEKSQRSMAMMRYRQNLQWASMPITEDMDADMKGMVERAKQENATIEQRFGKDDAGGQAPAPAPKAEEDDDTLLQKIHQEHPEWTPEQMVEEAVKRRGG